jgi:hypothetical protein
MQGDGNNVVVALLRALLAVCWCPGSAASLDRDAHLDLAPCERLACVNAIGSTLSHASYTTYVNRRASETTMGILRVSAI